MANKKKNSPQNNQANQNPKNAPSQISIVSRPTVSAKDLKDPGTADKQEAEFKERLERAFAAAIDTSNVGDVIEQLDMLLKGVSKTIKATDPDFRGGMRDIYDSLLKGFLDARDKQELASITLCVTLGRLYRDAGYWEIECAEDDDDRIMAIIDLFSVAFDLLDDPEYVYHPLALGCPGDVRKWIKDGLDFCDEVADFAEIIASEGGIENLDFEIGPDEE